eukprot:jgi/Picsp_1/2552/NSC_00783-R1_anaphase promoting complex subunit 10
MGERPPRQGAAGRLLATQQVGGQARGELYDKITIERSLNAYKYEKEIGNLAVWRVSSAKPGNGVDLLVDGRDDTYWQSDGSQPHLITLQFQQKIRVSRIAVQTDYRMDESYTPQRVALCIGTRWSDMKVLRTDDVHEPQGWIMIPLMKSSVTNLDLPPREWCELLFCVTLIECTRKLATTKKSFVEPSLLECVQP